MSGYYVEPRECRFVRELVGAGEQIRIPMRRQWFALLFLCFWLCGWSVGGVAAMYELVQTREPFLVFWLGGWAIGWLFAVGTIASQLAGSEIMRVVGRDLEISVGVGGLRRRNLYRGDRIRFLESSDPNLLGWSSWQRQGLSGFPFGSPRQGAIKFDYGAETVFAAVSVDEAEGRMIVDWLRPKLPRSATPSGEYEDSGGAAAFRAVAPK
jgi:hypothetical protein